MTPNMQKIHEVMEDMPRIHGQGTYGVTVPVLEHFDRILTPASLSAETGSGLTTIMCAIIGCQHTAIAPAPEEFQRMREYCAKHDISLKNVTFIAESSVDALPRLAENTFDFCFIDGCHGYPVAHIDFYYMSRMLKIGGVLGVDDTQIWPLEEMLLFLKMEEAWQFDMIADGTAFFTKNLADHEAREWDIQPYNAQKTAAIARRQSLQNSNKLLKQRWSKFFTLLRAGKYDVIVNKIQGKSKQPERQATQK